MPSDFESLLDKQETEADVRLASSMSIAPYSTLVLWFPKSKTKRKIPSFYLVPELCFTTGLFFALK